MKISTLTHKHGGKILTLDRIAHETYKGIASWEFVGAVEWHDGSKSDAAHIGPWALCCADGPNPELQVALDALSRYLDAFGTHHEQKSKRDGRVYSWTPHKPNGACVIEDVPGAPEAPL